MSTVELFYQVHALVVSILNSMARNPETVSLMLAFSLLFFVNQFDENRGHIQPPPLPAPLFGDESPVVDFYLGDLQATLEFIKLSRTDEWMVMYYAHWDTASLDAAKEFDLLAKEFEEVVTFVAVNCWWPYGSCKSRVKPPMYPIFVGHVLGREGVQFTGIQKLSEMRKFLKKLRNPFTYVQREEDVLALRAEDDTIAIAYFNFTSTLTPPGLASFHQAALSSLEKDPIHPTPFGVVTKLDLARDLGLNHSQSLVLLRNFNYTVTFPPTERFKAANILSFVYGEAREQRVVWISPAGVKSTILSQQIMKGPALLLFTSDEEDRGYQNNYYMLREVAMQYYQCGEMEEPLKDIIKFIKEKRNPHPPEDCIQSTVPKPCCQSLATVVPEETVRVRGNVCQICEQSSVSYSFNLDYCSVTAGKSCHSLWPLFGETVFGVPDNCRHLNNFYSPFSHCELCCTRDNLVNRHSNVCDQTLKWRTSRPVDQDCVYCSNESHGEGEQPKHLCENLYDRESAKVLESFRGLSCIAYVSVNFFAVRMEYFSVLAERLGVEKTVLNERSDVAIIIDEENEEYYLHPLDEDVTILSLQTFLLNFTNGELRRNLTSGDSPVRRKDTGCVSLSSSSSSTGCIVEVITDTFHEIVLDDSKDVVLLYYTPWCGACKRLAHIYLALAQLFESSENIVIARINGDQNDLPWEFVPLAYPTVILFPLKHKENSVIYPKEQPFTLPHLVQFVVQHSS